MLNPKNLIVSFMGTEDGHITCRVIHIPTGKQWTGVGPVRDGLAERVARRLSGEITGCNISKEFIEVEHSKLKRIKEPFRSECPKCLDGVLMVTRDKETLEIMAEDRCILCGQGFIYVDIETLKGM